MGQSLGFDSASLSERGFANRVDDACQCADSPLIMTQEKVKGPASYFPSIEKKYGRPIAEWKALVRAAMPAKHMELVAVLKNQHGMGHGHANAIVAHTLAEDAS